MSKSPSILKVQNALQEAPMSPLSRHRMAVSGHPLRARSAVCAAYSDPASGAWLDYGRRYGRACTTLWPTIRELWSTLS